MGCPSKDPFVIRKIFRGAGRKTSDPPRIRRGSTGRRWGRVGKMAAARGQKTLATLVKSLRSGPISNSSAPRLRHLPSLRFASASPPLPPRLSPADWMMRA
jgi:hypothetical protein